VKVNVQKMLNRIGASLISFAPTISFSSPSTSEQQQPTIITSNKERKKEEETTEEFLKKNDEKIKKLTTELQKTESELDGCYQLYDLAISKGDAFNQNHLKRRMKSLLDSMKFIQNQLNMSVEQQRRITETHQLAEQMRTNISCVKVLNTATREMKKELEAFKQLDPEDSDVALYEVMEEMEEMDYMLASYGRTSSSFVKDKEDSSDREFESYLAQRKSTAPVSSSTYIPASSLVVAPRSSLVSTASSNSSSSSMSSPFYSEFG
jgi:vacuolar-type H+-ATPase subunit I/STV1